MKIRCIGVTLCVLLVGFASVQASDYHDFLRLQDLHYQGQYDRVIHEVDSILQTDTLNYDLIDLGVRAAANSDQYDTIRDRILNSNDSGLVSLVRKTRWLDRHNRTTSALDAARTLNRLHPGPTASFLLAHTLESTGRIDEAREALRALPESARCYYNGVLLLARMHRQLDHYTESDSLYRLAHDLRPEQTEALVGQAWNMSLSGNGAGALAFLDSLSRERPDAWIVSTYAYMLERLGYNQKCYEVRQRAVALFPGSRSAQAKLAEAAARLGYREEATQLSAELTMAQRAYYGLSILYDNAFEIDDTLALQTEAEGLLSHTLNYAGIGFSYIKWLRDRGRDEEAQAWTDSIVTEMEVWHRCSLLSRLAALESPSAALDTLRSINREPFFNPGLRTIEVSLLYDLGRLDSARSLADSLLAPSPGLVYLLNGVFRDEWRTKEYARSASAIDKLAAIGMNPFEIEMRRLSLRMAQGDPGTVATLDSLRTEHPGHIDLLFYCSQLYGEEDDRDKMRATLEEYLVPGRMAFSIYPYLRYMLVQTDQTQRAESLLTAAIEQYPDAAKLYFERGVVYQAAGEYEMSQADMERALALDPAAPAYQQAVIAFSDKSLPLTDIATTPLTDTFELEQLSIDSILSLGKLVSADTAEDVVVLCDWHYQYFTHDGKLIRRRYRVEKALTEAGAEFIGDREFVYDGLYETPRVLLARTIGPNGGVDTVPMHKIYTSGGFGRSDSRYLQWVFPHVDSGSVVEMLVQFERGYADRDRAREYMIANEAWPIRDFRYVLSTPSNWEFNYRTSDGFELEESSKQSYSRLAWSAHDLQPLLYDTDAPELIRQEQSRWLRYAPKQSWAEVADWYWSKFADKLDTGQTIHQLAERLVSSASSLTDTIQVLYKYAVDSVRYEQVNFGEGAYIPRMPATTVENGYGDCKDKTALLLSLLKAVGIDGYPVLISTKLPAYFDAEVPYFGQFNHLIAYVPSAPNPWLDATCDDCVIGEMPRHLATRYAVLVGGENESPLVQTPEAESAVEGAHRIVYASPSPGGGVRFETEVSLIGQTATNLRTNLGGASTQEIRQFVAEQLGIGLNRGSELIDFEVVSTRSEDNDYLINATFEDATAFGKQANYSLLFPNALLVNLFLSVDTAGRTTDLELEYPITVSDALIITPGDKWDLYSNQVGWTQGTDWLTATFEVSEQADTIKCLGSIRLNKVRVPRDSIETWLKAIERIHKRFENQLLVFRRVPDPQRIAALESALSVAPDDPSLALSLANAYLGEDLGGDGCWGGEYRQKAMDILARALESNPNSEGLLLNYAAVAVRENRLHLADSILANMPAGGQMGLLANTLRIAVLEPLGRLEEAIPIVKDMLPILGDTEGRVMLTQVYLQTDNIEEAKKQLQILEAMQVDSTELIQARLELAFRTENWQEAEQLIATLPDTGNVGQDQARLQLYNNQKDYRAAIELLEEFMIDEPDDARHLNNLAWNFYLLDSNLTQALEYAERATIIGGECSFAARNTKGAILLALGKLDEAEAELTACLADESASSQSINHYLLGKLWKERGDNDKAAEFFHLAMLPGGNSEYIAMAKKELESL